MLDAVRTALEATRESLKAYEDRTTDPPKEKTNTPWSYWNEEKDSFRAWYVETILKPYIEVKVREEEEKALKDRAKTEQETKKNLRHSLKRCRNLIIYFEEIERELIDCGAKTWAELNPAAAAAQEALKKNAPPPQTYGRHPSLARQNVDDSEAFFAMYYKTPLVPLTFNIFLDVWSEESSEPAPAYTTPLYEALFESCWKGNNERIKELCLPPETGERNNNIEYLQITCEVRFSPSVPDRKLLHENVHAEISSFKEYPREALALKSGESIKSLIRTVW